MIKQLQKLRLINIEIHWQNYISESLAYTYQLQLKSYNTIVMPGEIQNKDILPSDSPSK